MTNKVIRKIMWGIILCVLLLPVISANAEEGSKKERGAYSPESKETTILLRDVSKSMQETFAKEIEQMQIDENSFSEYLEFSDKGKTNLYYVLNESLQRHNSVSIITDLWDTTEQQLQEFKGKDLRIYVPYSSTNQEGVSHVEEVVYQYIAPYLKDSFVKVIYLDDSDGVIYLTSSTALQRDEQPMEEVIKETEVIEKQAEPTEEVEAVETVEEISTQEGIEEVIPDKTLKDYLMQVIFSIITGIKYIIGLAIKGLTSLVFLIVFIVAVVIGITALLVILAYGVAVLCMAIIFLIHIIQKIVEFLLSIIIGICQIIGDCVIVFLEKHPFIAEILDIVLESAVQIIFILIALLSIPFALLEKLIQSVEPIGSQIILFIMFITRGIVELVNLISAIARVIVRVIIADTIVINTERYPQGYSFIEWIFTKFHLIEGKIIIAFKADGISETMDFKDNYCTDSQKVWNALDALEYADNRGASKIVLFSNLPEELGREELNVYLAKWIYVVSPSYYVLSKDVFKVLKKWIPNTKGIHFPIY